MTDRRPWERQEGESARAFKAFATYRDLGPKRSLDAAYSKAHGVKSASKQRRATGTWHKWSREHHWVDRATAYDDHIDAKARAEAERILAERRAKLIEDEWEAGELATGRARELLEFPLVEQKVDRDGQTIIIKPTKWRLSDAKVLLEIGDKLKRNATGQATERSEVTGKDGGPIEVQSSHDLDNLTTEEAAELLRLIRKAKAGPEGTEE